MKNSKQYSEKLKNFLKKSFKGRNYESAQFPTNTDCMVRGILSEFISEKMVDKCLKLMREHFVDWNDLRVSRNEEIISILDKAGVNPDLQRKISDDLINTLNAIFTNLDRTTLEELDEAGKKQAKQILDDVGGISEFAADYVLLFLKHSHVLPVNQCIADMLKSEGLIHPDSENKEIKNFVVRQITSKDTEKTFYLLRELAAEYEEKEKEKSKSSAKKKTASKKAAKKTTKKKSAAKKKAASGKKKTEAKTDKESSVKTPSKKTSTKKTSTKKASAKKKSSSTKSSEKETGSKKKASSKTAKKTTKKTAKKTAKKTTKKTAKKTAKKTTKKAPAKKSSAGSSSAAKKKASGSSAKKTASKKASASKKTGTKKKAASKKTSAKKKASAKKTAGKTSKKASSGKKTSAKTKKTKKKS